MGLLLAAVQVFGGAIAIIVGANLVDHLWPGFANPDRGPPADACPCCGDDESYDGYGLCQECQFP
jgi:hypothetical protein